MSIPQAMDRHRKVAARWLLTPLALFSALFLAGCAGLPSLEDRPASRALSPSEAAETGLGQLFQPMADAHPGQSGIHILVDPHDAFAARTFLADAAQRTLDVQYYIWRLDTTGLLLLAAIERAADRGVQVRLLLDDYNTSGMDSLLATLNAHENIEIRLFNPFTVRRPRFWEILTDLSRVNRRMHNKSFTADNSATIVGGRNVADEYFGATDTLFTDLDVMALGPVVNEVSEAFDRYWRSDSAYPAERILAPDETPSESPTPKDAEAKAYLQKAETGGLAEAIRERELELCWADTELVIDDPAKGLALADRDELFYTQLREAVGTPRSRLDVMSSYFIPTKVGVDELTGLAQRGVQVRVLTNSLQATDVAMVHAGYAKWRDELLEEGAQLYEMKRSDNTSPPGEQTAGPYGSASSTLHAKAFAVDGEQLVVGSFNADPRSINLNTELGLVIDCPEMALKVHDAFPERVMEHAYEVRLDDDGGLYWLEKEGDDIIRHDSEPGATLLQRLAVPIFSVLPIDWLL